MVSGNVPIRIAWWLSDLLIRKSPSGEPFQHFDEACAALLREILVTAGIVDGPSSATSNPKIKLGKPKSLAVLDVGFGCGDQIWELSRLVGLDGWNDVGYVGLTLNKSQLQAASRRLDRELADVESKEKRNTQSFRVFGANAASPASWSLEVQEAVRSLGDEKFQQRWLLALDCLYHFSPSRESVLRLAAQSVGANFMAFDLMLNRSVPLHRILIARVVGVLMGCPWRAFLTEPEYVKQLVACGYERQSVVIRDVSDNVFPGLVEYLRRQDEALSDYGISLGGGFRLARGVFGWFGRTGVIKGTIVVARLGREDSAKRPSRAENRDRD